MRLLSFVGLWLYLTLIAAFSALETEQVILKAVRGRDVELPCGQDKVFLDGPASYIQWMKDNKEILYRFPDDKSSRTSSIATFEQVYELQCKRDVCQDPTSLQLKHVENLDSGTYCCRVHYQASPTVEYSIELKVVDSPGTPKIFSAEGLDLTGNVCHLSLGTNLTLICEVKEDGLGTLVWWERNDVEVARTETVQDGVLRTEVQIINASRDELDVHYECFAQNADVTDPLSAGVVVKMYLPPMSVEIRLNNNLDFEAGQPRVVDCVVVGCVPPPTITWHLGDTMLRSSVHKELHDGNFTVSSLTLAPSLRDDKHELTCRAHNSHLPREVFEDKVVLNVGFRPTCLNDQVEVIGYVAGQTEMVTCTVEAYPEPLQFSWIFADTKTLYTGVKKVRGYQHRYSTTLTWKPQDQDQGELLCRAINLLGEQKRPCAYSIVAGGPPLTPDCHPIKTDSEIIKISCEKNWDGGRPQTIHLELQTSGNTVQNVTDNYGSFAIPQLQDTNLTAVVYASNSRGRSGTKVLQITPRMDNSTADEGQLEKQKTGILVLVIIGTIVFGTLLGILARCVKFFHDKRGMPRSDQDIIDDDATITIRSDGSLHRQPEPLPHSQTNHRCPHVTLRMTSNANHYLLTPSKAARVLGVPNVTTIKEERFPDLISDEMATYFV